MRRTERNIRMIMQSIEENTSLLRKYSRPATKSAYDARIRELEKVNSSLQEMLNKTPQRVYFDRFGNQTEDGEFVLSPIEQEDGSISYWVAQKGYNLARYCFTIGHGGASYEESVRFMPDFINMYLKQLMK